VTYDLDVDVAIAGGGACGLVTALRAAADPGLVVAVFEKSAREGCNAAISSGSLAAGGTRFQAELGIVDSPQRHADEIIAQSGDDEWRPVVEAVCAVAPEFVEWLADTGYPVELGTDMPRAGMSVPRLHTDRGRLGGGRLVRHLKELVAARDNIAFVDEAPVTGLVTAGAGVDGLTIRQNGVEQRVRADAVVLACDGFANDPALTRTHLGHLGSPFYGGVSTATGDALGWVEPFGTRLRNMGAALRTGLVVVGHGTRVSPALPFNGAVLIDDAGRRFVDEASKGYSALAGVLQQRRGETAVMVWDDEAMARTKASELMRASIDAGAMRRADSTADLALRLGLDEALVTAALEPMPGRRRLVPPFHFAWVTHGILTTQGGLVVDAAGRVLDRDDVPVPGLYAGGGTVCGLAGASSDGYMSGSGLLSAFGLGWIVGGALAAAYGVDTLGSQS
jgi:fumarate reductase flavoprotein subunit